MVGAVPSFQDTSFFRLHTVKGSRNGLSGFFTVVTKLILVFLPRDLIGPQRLYLSKPPEWQVGFSL